MVLFICEDAFGNAVGPEIFLSRIEFIFAVIDCFVVVSMPESIVSGNSQSLGLVAFQSDDTDDGGLTWPCT